jgi:hypothetical protein
MLDISILVSMASVSYTLQTIYNLHEKIKMEHSKYIESLVKESVEHSYITYIYDVKQKCKIEKINFEYDVNKSNEIARQYFYNSYSKPLFREINFLKINKLIKDELNFYRAKSKL